MRLSAARPIGYFTIALALATAPVKSNIIQTVTTAYSQEQVDPYSSASLVVDMLADIEGKPEAARRVAEVVISAYAATKEYGSVEEKLSPEKSRFKHEGKVLFETRCSALQDLVEAATDKYQPDIGKVRHTNIGIETLFKEYKACGFGD